MKVARSICSREMMKADVLDSSGEKIGKVGDLTFSFDGELKLSKFILSGSRWEEFLESIKFRPDLDPIFNESLIEKIDDNIHINTTKNSLKTTLESDAIPTGDIRLSDFMKMDIVDKNGKKVGRAIDVDFDIDGSVSMIVGGSFIEEKLEAAGLKTDVDIIVPGDVISSIGEKIHLLVSEDTLKTTMEDALKTEDVIQAQTEKVVRHDVIKVRLFTHRPM
ncbi:MAG: PRC-barrel domain-containing protein [Candidatus Thorarchaeota archaeon]